MNDITFTVVGNLVTDVELRYSRAGDPVASFRLASTVRRYDRSRERWIDGDTHYIDVSCWRSLAPNVYKSLKKGMPVVVTGRLRSREVARPCGDASHNVRYFDLEAVALGPDLARGTTTFERVAPQRTLDNESRAVADSLAEVGIDLPQGPNQSETAGVTASSVA